MAKPSKLPLNRVLNAVDCKQRDFYDQLNDEERRAFSPFLLNRYTSSVKTNNTELASYWLMATNEHFNKYHFDYAKYPKLQWLLLTAVSPGLGSVYHEWIAVKKKKTAGNKHRKFLEKLYPNAKSDEIDVLLSVNDEKNIQNLAKSLGYDDKAIKQELL